MKTKEFETKLSRKNGVIELRATVQKDSASRYVAIYVILGLIAAISIVEFYYTSNVNEFGAMMVLVALGALLVVLAKRYQSRGFWHFQIHSDRISVRFNSLGFRTIERQRLRSDLSLIELSSDETELLIFYNSSGKRDVFVSFVPLHLRVILAKILRAEWGVDWRLDRGPFADGIVNPDAPGIKLPQISGDHEP